MSAQTGKKFKKKAKAKTVTLNDFLGDSQGPGVIKSWADEAEEDGHVVNNSLTYQSSSTPKVIQLPTAPRAARTVEIDHSRIPENGPYTAFVGNLPYEVDEYLLKDFFKGLDIVNIRLPEENGRFKGFGYIQFNDKQSLIKALEMNEQTLQKRNIRIDIADNQNKDGGGSWGRSGGDRYNSHGAADPTEGNWRKAAADESARQADYNDRRDYDSAPRDDRRGSSHGGYSYGEQNRQYNQRRQYSDHRGSYRSDGYDGGSYRGSQGYDQHDDRRSDDRRRYSDRSGYDDRPSYGNRGGDDRGYDRPRDNNDYGYDRPRYSGNRGYERPRYNDRYGGSRDPEPPRERQPIRLQPRQKPLDKDATTTRSSSIFGDAKPVDTTAKERAIEEKLYQKQKSLDEPKPPEKKSSNIFGEAKPIDTSAREREIEEKIQAQQDRLMSSVKDPVAPARTSVFGDAKPVDTAARDKQFEEKLRRQEKEYTTGRESGRNSRLSSERSDDGGVTSPKRRSRTSSARSNDEQYDGPSSRKQAESQKEVRKPEYKPAPPPKENAWGRKPLNLDKPAPVVANRQVSKEKLREDTVSVANAWSKGAPRTERGEREEAEGNSKEDEEEERRPEGAADDDAVMRNRNEPGDGSEDGERPYPSSSSHREPRYKSDRNQGSYQKSRRTPAKYASGPGGRQSANQYRNRNYSDGARENRRRGDGDSHSYRYDGSHSNEQGQSHNRRDGGRDRPRSKNDWTDGRRDSSRDSRPECDRSDAAGQEQPPSGRAPKVKTKSMPIDKEEPVVDFVGQSKFALLSVDDSDDEIAAD